ncbi:hypothetical protein E2C01_015684 [Portunus trituberculatus]|uniref:Secreted protein n=1 Tax=Portunus trituberculatus TaxID=210409 RepID=A0A5B7DNQ3_PORTR|nr:hypothetical protein [Portunus trituberculatus]
MDHPFGWCSLLLLLLSSSRLHWQWQVAFFGAESLTRTTDLHRALGFLLKLSLLSCSPPTWRN